MENSLQVRFCEVETTRYRTAWTCLLRDFVRSIGVEQQQSSALAFALVLVRARSMINSETSLCTHRSSKSAKPSFSSFKTAVSGGHPEFTARTKTSSCTNRSSKRARSGLFLPFYSTQHLFPSPKISLGVDRSLQTCPTGLFLASLCFFFPFPSSKISLGVNRSIQNMPEWAFFFKTVNWIISGQRQPKRCRKTSSAYSGSLQGEGEREEREELN